MACAFIMIGGKYTLVGIILFLLWDVLDCTDGNIARLTHTSSPVGVFLMQQQVMQQLHLFIYL